MIHCFLGVLEEILRSYDEEKITELSETALRLLEELYCTDGSKAMIKDLTVELQKIGINVWNKAVTLKSATAISLHLNAQCMCMQ